MEIQQSICKHEALQESVHLSPDIFTPLFDHILELDEFRNWHKHGSSWQLRCVGGPGSGKTTLSAIVIDCLRKTFTNNAQIASIFIKKDVSPRDPSFLQAFLESLYWQLSKSLLEESNDYELTHNLYITYRNLCLKPSGHKPSVRRLKVLRKAVYSRIAGLDRAFLVLDDIDRCYESVGNFLELELSRLQRHGLSVFVTSRLPRDRLCEEWICDAEGHEGRHCFAVFSSCMWCWTSQEGTPVICEVCVGRDSCCPICNEPILFQPFEHLELRFGTPRPVMQKFVEWDLEREHGDLGLESCQDRKPPLSVLGRSLVKSPKGLDNVVHGIVLRAHQNVAIAKLDLDSLLDLQSANEISFAGDRLPENIVTLFEDVLTQIKLLPDAEKHMALAAILATVHDPDGNGTPFCEVERWIRESSVQPQSHLASYLNVDEVLRVARGFLNVDGSPDEIMAPYHPMLQMYANEHYDEALFWEKTHMKFGRLFRSKTSRPTLKRMKRMQTML